MMLFKRLLLLLLISLQTDIALSMSINGPLVRAGLENQANDPTTTLTGRVYWNTTNGKARLWNGTAWQDFGTGGGASAAYTILPTAVTAVGGAFSPLAHPLDTYDWSGYTTAGKIAIWNLAGNANDSSGALSCTSAACNLTVNGSPVYTATDPLGTVNNALTFDGVNDELVCSDAFCKPGDNNWTWDAFIAPTDWSPSGSQYFVAQYDASGNRGFELYLSPSNGITFNVYDTGGGTTLGNLTFPGANSFADGSWHHVAARFDTTNNKMAIFVDGKKVGEMAWSTQFASTTSMKIGSGGATSTLFFAGKMAYIGYTKGINLTDDEIRKHAARRFDHSLAIGPESQLWMGTWTRSDSGVSTPLDSFVVSKDNNHAWLDFSGVATGAYVSAKMLNTQSSTTNVSQASYDSGYLSSTPSSTIAHGIGDVPASLVVYYETSTNKFTPLYGSNFCEMDATNLYCDWTSLTVAAGSRVRIQAWAAGSMSAVPAASAAQSGVVNTTSQAYSGEKEFIDDATFDGTITPSGGILGRTDGAAACPGCVGEVKTGTLSTAVTLIGTYQNMTSAALSLDAGNWLVVAEFNIYHSSSDNGYSRYRLVNQTDATTLAVGGWGTQTGLSSAWTPVTIMKVVRVTATKALIIEATDPNATTHMQFNVTGSGLDSQNEFYAIRLY